MFKKSRPATWLVLVFALAVAALQGNWLGDGGISLFGSAATQDRATRLGVPPEAIDTLDLILAGGPFPYRQDNTTFHNRERLLPRKPTGYYREYTVVTPGASNRGARRWVTGGDPPEVFYYTDDHYRSFRQIDIRRAAE